MNVDGGNINNNKYIGDDKGDRW